MLPRVWGWVVGGGDGGEGRGQPADSSGSSGRRGRHMWQKARGAAVARGSAAAAGRHLFGRAAPADVAGPCLLTCLPGPLLLQRTTPAPGVARATRWRPTANASSRRAKPRRRCSPSLSLSAPLSSLTHTHAHARPQQLKRRSGTKRTVWMCRLRALGAACTHGCWLLPWQRICMHTRRHPAGHPGLHVMAWGWRDAPLHAWLALMALRDPCCCCCGDVCRTRSARPATQMAPARCASESHRSHCPPPRCHGAANRPPVTVASGWQPSPPACPPACLPARQL